MIKKIKFHFDNNKELIKDNIILFMAILSANLINYFFHFYVGRSLGPEEYGIFGVLLSIIYITVIPLVAIQTTLSKFVAEMDTKNENRKISHLFFRSLKKMGLIGFIVGIIFLTISPVLGSFLKIKDLKPLILIGAFMIFAFLVPVFRGFLQGIQRFGLLGLTYVTESLTKIIIGVPLVYLFGVNGAIWAFGLSFFFPVVILFLFIKKIFRGEKEKFNTKRIYSYSFPVLIMLIFLTGFYTIDTVLVKRFFDALDAGQYIALSLFGKIIFFGSMSISMVMFPKVSESNLNNKSSKHLLIKSLLIALFLGFSGSLFYFIMPKFIINLLFGKEYLVIAPLLGVFGLIMTVYSLSYIISYYNIALHRVKFLYLLFFFNILEIILIWLFHNTLLEVVISLIIVVILMFLSLIIYTLKNGQNIGNYPSVQ